MPTLRSSKLKSVQAKQMLKHAEAVATLLRAMANEQRLLVLCHLVAGELSVGQLLDAIDLSQSSLSQHLAVLREAQIVTTRRDGQSVFYSLAPGPAQVLMNALHGIYCSTATEH